MPDDRLWVATQVRYHARAGDEVCSAVTDTVLQHALHVGTPFGLGPEAGSAIDYYKYRDSADLDASGVCPKRAAACSNGRSAWSPAALDRHELTHVYFSSLPPSLRLLEEGIAEALSCGVPAVGAPNPWVSLDTALAIPYDALEHSSYALAGHFVGFLVNGYGAERFVELYRAVSRDATAQELARQFQRTYGLELEDVWQAAAMSAPELGCLRWWECLGPPLEPGDWQALETNCSHADAFRTFEVATSSAYLFQILPGASAQLLSCDQGRQMPSTPQPVDSVANFYTLSAGRYFVGSAQPGWSVRLDEVHADDATACGTPAELKVLAAGLSSGVTIHADGAAALWVKLADLDSVTGSIQATYPSAVRLRACRGCSTDAVGCTNVPSGARVEPSAELVFEVDATRALATDQWLRLAVEEVSP
ncbi:MAG: hypothetical protein EOO73_28130 [Myxococcales bacterium]|nr:MAG: hypothetical protein EOO73_28130 [Myxococcales bacterium]